MMDLVAAAGGLSHAINIAKTVRDADKALDKATLKAQMADVMDKATDAKFALSEAREQIANRDAEIARLRAAFEERVDLVLGDGDYKFRTNENGDAIGYPMCPKCETLDGRIVQLKQHRHGLAAQCPACSSVFEPVACYVEAEGGQGTETRDSLILPRKSGRG